MSRSRPIHHTLLCAGLATYSSLRPLVYRESSVVLLCYQDQGRPGLPAWVREVRAVSVLRNTNLLFLLPIFLCHKANMIHLQRIHVYSMTYFTFHPAFYSLYFFSPCSKD